MTRAIRVMIVDDHEVVREGLRTFLAEEPEIAVVAVASNGEEAVKLAAASAPDVVLMDMAMPRLDGIEATRRLRAVSPRSQVLVLTSFADDHKVREAVQAGAIGYLMKDVLRPDLLQALRAASQGNPTLHPEAQRHLMNHVAAPPAPTAAADLTARERDVLCLVASGRSNKEIAAALHLTEGTVKGYVSAILAKLDVADRTQAALYAVKHGVCPDG